MDAGDPCDLHAREWMTPLSCAYLIQEFSKEDTDLNDLLDRFDVILSPVSNPDGYEHSWNLCPCHRKNMNGAPTTSCSNAGVDLNRNFGPALGDGQGDWGWLNLVNPFSDTYQGPSASSEKETQSIQMFVDGVNVMGYIDIHSYGQWIFDARGTDYQVEKGLYSEIVNDWWYEDALPSMIEVMEKTGGLEWLEWDLYSFPGEPTIFLRPRER